MVDPGVNPSLINGEIAIDEALTIIGQGASSTSVSAGNLSRVFNVGSVSPGITVLVKNMTLSGGRTPDGASGGAILNAGTLTISNSTLTGNSTGSGATGAAGSPGVAGGSGGSGGAISSSGTLTISNSTLKGNSTGSGGSGGSGNVSDGGAGGSGGNGGAVANSGTMTISASALTGNSSGAGGDGGAAGAAGGGPLGGVGGRGGIGAAVYNTGTMTITSSTLAGNSGGRGGSGGTGGGDATPAPIGAANGTPGGVGGSGGSGGAVGNSASGTLTISDSTLANNSGGSGGPGGTGGPAQDGGSGRTTGGKGGDGGAGGPGGAGGALVNLGALTITDTTVAGNHAGDGGNGGSGTTGGKGGDSFVGPGGLVSPGGDGGNGGGGGGGGSGGSGGAIAGSPAGTIANSILSNSQTGPGGAAGSAGGGGSGGYGTTFGTNGSAGAAGSAGPAGSDPSCAAGSATDGGHNIAFPAPGSCPAGFATGNPQLGPLQDNGGPTETMAIGPGSAALDQVPSVGAGCPVSDQRGVLRPQGPACDIGAFELENPTTLTVSRSGTGAGTVTSSPAGIDCGASCSHAYDQGTTVALTANPASGSTFAGWSGGGCSGTGACEVTMGSAQTVSATFRQNPPAQHTLTVSGSGTGAGTVTSSPLGIACGSGCVADFADGAQVTLTATAARGSKLAGWSGGGCSGTGTCTVTMRSDQAVSATFIANPLVSSAPKCTLRPARGTVLLPTHKKHKSKRTTHASTGTLALLATCNQRSAVTLTGTLVEQLHPTRQHGKRSKLFRLGAVHASVAAGIQTALTVKLPAAALAALAYGWPGSATFTLVAANVNGSVTASTTITT